MAYSHVREALKKAFPYKTWWRKVDQMTDSQAIAVYVRLHSEGKI